MKSKTVHVMVSLFYLEMLFGCSHSISKSRLQSAPTGKILLTWSDTSSNEVGYTLERSENGGAFQPIATLPPGTTGFTDSQSDSSGFAAGISYSYRVRAYNSAGNSPYSNTAQAIAK